MAVEKEIGCLHDEVARPKQQVILCQMRWQGNRLESLRIANEKQHSKLISKKIWYVTSLVTDSKTFYSYTIVTTDYLINVKYLLNTFAHLQHKPDPTLP